jgi:alpha-N-acetylglucosaminidase
MSDAPDGKVAIDGSTASELAYGVGLYFREICNMTIGWKWGGGSKVFIPSQWPTIGSKSITKKRLVPWSYMMNVCTHSYSLVWYSWSDWEEFIDWMALSGINLFLAMTGQEEVQYKVFQKFGVDDASIRSWFNGPAFLTW